MSTQTSPSQGLELYDSIMAEIEPELMSANIARMDEITANDTPAERKARAVRYAAAFRELEKRMQQRRKDWSALCKSMERSVISLAEDHTKRGEALDLSAMEASFKTAI